MTMSPSQDQTENTDMLTEIAILYYQEGATQEEISKKSLVYLERKLVAC